MHLIVGFIIIYLYSYFFRFPKLRFDYQDPVKNFDRSKVHGLVAKLMRVKNPETAKAIEVMAGGKGIHY